MYSTRTSISSINKSIKYRKYRRNNAWGLNEYVWQCVLYFRFFYQSCVWSFRFGLSTVDSISLSVGSFSNIFLSVNLFISSESFVAFYQYWNRCALEYTHTLVDGLYHNFFFYSLVHTLQFFHIDNESLLFSLKLVVTYSPLPFRFLFSSGWKRNTNSIFIFDADRFTRGKLYIYNTQRFYIVLDLFCKRFHCWFSVFMYGRVECKQTSKRSARHSGKKYNTITRDTKKERTSDRGTYGTRLMAKTKKMSRKYRE